ncbi:hypothetical protein NC651_022265 [Populus alba x Populus x berolinensis]|nr:hypothetical protein NC651_022265 [Populus alba x Populus x berolinensis]
MNREEKEEEEEIVCLDESFFINDNYRLTTFTFGSQVIELLCLHSASRKGAERKALADPMAMIVYQLQSPLIQSNAGRSLSGCVVLLAVYAKKTELFACACFGRPLITAEKADFDLTGQLVWPGALLLNDYLAKNAEMLQGCSIIELGSGVGVTGILCSRFCPQLLLTDHNDEILKKNIELCASSENPNCCAELVAEKLEWGNSDHIDQILQRYSRGFDLILGADIYILVAFLLSFSRKIAIKKLVCSTVDDLKKDWMDIILPSVKHLICMLTWCYLSLSVERLLHVRGGQCKFILAYVSRAKSMDSLIMKQAAEHGMRMVEVTGTRSVVRNLEGVIFEVALQ